MTSKVNTNFEPRCDLFPDFEWKLTRRYLYDEDGGIIGDNPEFIKLEEQDHARRSAEFDAFFADLLDDSGGNESGLAPADDNQVRPAKSTLLATPEEQAGIEALDDTPAAPLLDDDASEPESKALLRHYHRLLSGNSTLSPDEVVSVQKIAEKLTSLNIPPIERGVTAFDSKTCKINKNAEFVSNFLQECDQQWIQNRYPGHPTNHDAWGGIFADIFNVGPFDWDKALKIAEFERGPAEKAKCLNLSPSQQRALVVLRGKDEKNRRETIRRGELRQARADKERLLQIEREAVEVRNIVTEYKARTPRARLNIDEHVLVWRCLAMCEGQKNYVSGARKAYEKLTGEVNSRASFKEKIGKLESILAGSKLIKWRGQ
jgi:hypothetical protein